MHTHRLPALALLLGFAGLAACSDPVDPPRPAAASAVSTLVQGAAAGTTVAEPPSVRVTTAAGRPVPGIGVTFTVQAGGGMLTGADQVTDADGIAAVGTWVLGTAPGRNTVRVTVAGLGSIDIVFEAMALPDDCPGLVTLDLELGEFVRLKDSGTPTYSCLLFDAEDSAGSEYVLLFENLAPTGGVSAGLFPGATGDTSLAFTLDVAPLTAAAAGPIRHVRLAPPASPDADDAHAWDFGAGRIREHVPAPPVGGTPGVQLVRGGRTMDVNSLDADPVPGDTIEVGLMAAIPRLGIIAESQKAVIRHVSDDLIIAEDVRLTTELVREGGGFNTPLTEQDLAAIATEYSTVAKVQGDIFFQDRHNLAVEEDPLRRVTAVHSLMPADNVWGYTYAVSNYFVWDYWVGTDGSTKGLNQHPQRVTDNLFMHEIAHMRHMGMLQHSGRGIAGRGNLWLVEGFARFAERLPITARILGTTTPSRTANIVLPRNPAFNNAYFLDDVPTYLDAGGSFYFGYQRSSFLFDYFADQVALAGGDWLAAVRELLLTGAARTSLDQTVQKWLPGTTAADLITRARIALYTDDIGTPGLPGWTQYHQFRLRESRPAPQQLADRDPRVQWMSIPPTVQSSTSGTVPAGGAMGFIIAGGQSGAGIIRPGGTVGAQAWLAVARIR